MADAILVAKLFVPAPSPKAVLRPRLIERLNEGLATGRKLALISAPAGSGKTTLISEWVAGCGHRVAWLSLDAQDNDPARFLAYLIASLQTIAGDIGKGALTAIQTAQTTAGNDFLLTTLLNEIATIPERFILVLDDYHLLDSEPIDRVLAFLLDHLPPQMHLVIATREDPSLPLARYRARGQLTEVRAADLQFTPAEAAEFLNQMMGLNLSDGDVAALEARTEGWIAGLNLAAVSMQGHPDTASFIKSFTSSHRFVLDYLVEEVLQQQPESIQTFLLHTSILDRMCGPLCDALLLATSASGQETLVHLERANLFIVPLDSERHWYRYHHLFGDLLRRRLGKPHDLPAYHLRASAWYEANNDLADAFHHALAAGDFERAARLAEAVWPDMEHSFQTAAWLGWVKNLPDVVVSARPRLSVMIGRALSDIAELDASETYLQYAEQALAHAMDVDEFRSLPGTIALIRGSNAQIAGDLAATAQYTQLSLQLAPEDDTYLRAQAAITLGFNHWATGNLEDSLDALFAWMEDMQKLGNPMFAIASVFAVADMQVILGRLGAAEEALRQAIPLAAAFGPEAETVTAHHHLGLAMLAHERGDEAAAAQFMATAATLGQRNTFVDWHYRWNLAQAQLKESAGEWEAALELLDQAGRAYVKNPIPIMRPIAARQAQIFLKQGRLEKAQAWARARGLSTADESLFLAEYELITLARVRLAEGSLAGVTDLLERLLASAETQNRTGSIIEILLAQALVYQAQDDHPRSQAMLERALALAEPENYFRVFVDEGEAMRQLLLKFRSAPNRQASDSLRRYAGKILAALSLPETSPSPTTTKGRTAENFEPLTDRELEILRLIAAGQSNAQISQQLYLALSTVKGHNLRLFGKLGVRNRTEAVARARELGLL